jgi:hypothetical protein
LITNFNYFTQDVHEKFPIPLINRLEKHYLGMETMLTEGNFFSS